MLSLSSGRKPHILNTNAGCIMWTIYKSRNTCFKFGHFSPHVDLNQCTQCISSIYAFVVYNLQLKEVWIKRIKFWKQGRTGQDTLIHSLDLFIWSEWNLACDDNCYFLFFVEIRVQIPDRREYISMAQLPPDLPTSLFKRWSFILTHAALIFCSDISNRRESSWPLPSRSGGG